MTKTRFVGDIHGDFYSYMVAIQSAESSIQVGDFGFGFNSYWDERAAEFHQTHPHHRFIRGNHDSLVACRASPGFIPDGFVQNDMMFIGGAWSIDRAFRTEGIDWWADEECSTQEFYRLIDVYEATKPRIMVTHDAPLSVTEQMFIRSGKAIFGKNAKPIKTLTGLALETMFEINRPDLWIFGHWHHTVAETIRGTRFQCIGECDFVDVDLENGDVSTYET